MAPKPGKAVIWTQKPRLTSEFRFHNSRSFFVNHLRGVARIPLHVWSCITSSKNKSTTALNQSTAIKGWKKICNNIFIYVCIDNWVYCMTNRDRNSILNLSLDLGESDRVVDLSRYCIFEILVKHDEEMKNASSESMTTDQVGPCPRRCN